MVAAARVEGRWLILDNRTMRLVADGEVVQPDAARRARRRGTGRGHRRRRPSRSPARQGAGGSLGYGRPARRALGRTPSAAPAVTMLAASHLAAGWLAGRRCNSAVDSRRRGEELVLVRDRTDLEFFGMAMLSPIGLIKSRAFRLLQFLALAVGLVAMPAMTVPDLSAERAYAGFRRALVLPRPSLPASSLAKAWLRARSPKSETHYLRLRRGRDRSAGGAADPARAHRSASRPPPPGCWPRSGSSSSRSSCPAWRCSGACSSRKRGRWRAASSSS